MCLDLRFATQTLEALPLLETAIEEQTHPRIANSFVKRLRGCVFELIEYQFSSY